MSLAGRTLRIYRNAMATVGQVVSVRRYAGKGAARAVAKEADVMARVMGFAPSELVGAVVQGDRKVILLNDPDAAVPAGKVTLASMLPLTTDDKIVVGGTELEIMAADDSTRRVGAELIALELQVRG
ncbi:hypothetical protein JQ561_33935 [Bradyrhizobium diazoefficiens]|nr:hypothetical protein [Bradyrhizobium diazoefficiens]MBR0931638.1 hypothetical protein [Bradyrhizobium diazoefficiens]